MVEINLIMSLKHLLDLFSLQNPKMLYKAKYEQFFNNQEQHYHFGLFQPTYPHLRTRLVLLLIQICVQNHYKKKPSKNSQVYHQSTQVLLDHQGVGQYALHLKGESEILTSLVWIHFVKYPSEIHNFRGPIIGGNIPIGMTQSGNKKNPTNSTQYYNHKSLDKGQSLGVHNT